MDLNFRFPISKFEKLEDGRLLIAGVATDETLDTQGDILDYDGTKKAIKAWRGNVREAHDPKKPVGKALDIAFDDKARSVTVEAFISSGAKDTQAKITEGVLTCFSVGGSAPKKARMEKQDGKEVRRVLDWDMTELSVVDAGANPNAVITLVKADGATDQLAPEPEPPKDEPVTSTPEPNRFAEKLLDALGDGAVKKDANPPEAPPEAPAAAPEAEAVPPVPAPPEPPVAAETAKADEVPECEKGDCGKCAKCNESKKADEVEASAKVDAPAPVEPAAEKTATTEKHYGGGEDWDIANALVILDGLKSLKEAELAEGEKESPCLTELATAISAVKRFIALEAGELVAQDAAASQMGAGSGDVVPVGVEAMISASVESAMQKHAIGDTLPGLVKSAVAEAVAELKKQDDGKDDERIEKLATAIGHGLTKANDPVLKAVGEFKGLIEPELKAHREMLEKIAKQPAVARPARFEAGAGSAGGPPVNAEVLKALHNALAATNSSEAQVAIRQQIAFAERRSQ